MIAPPDPEDLALVKKWFRRLSEQVQAVDFAGAHPLFAEDMIAFGTFENFITGREAVERAQWRNVWPVTSGFHFRMDDIRAIVSPDRLMAIGMGVFDSTGYHEDGTPYERPGRTTVACRAAGSARIGSPITRICRCSATCRAGPSGSASRADWPRFSGRRGERPRAGARRWRGRRR
jgi:ketosteroid isomerase-like protein